MDLIREEDKRGQKRRVPLKVLGGETSGFMAEERVVGRRQGR